MKKLKIEILGNYERFSKKIKEDLLKVMTSHEDNEKKVFFESYSRIATYQAWRTILFVDIIDSESLGFYLEAQNDALTSHCLAYKGMWRASLQSLRSSLENTMQMLFYMDHPVELALWNEGKHRLEFSSLISYLKGHPKLMKYRIALKYLENLTTKHRLLSLAVHGSSEPFRMTADADGPIILTSDKARLGKWRTRETATVRSLNILLAMMFNDKIDGNKLPNLKKSIGAIPLTKTQRDELKTYCGVNIPD